MAGERMKLQVRERERRGSADARRLRKEGYIPGVLYGSGMHPHAICVEERELRRVLTGPSGLHAILDVVLDGEKAAHASILKDYQQDPLRGHISHVDLQEVRLDQPIQASVNVQLIGEPEGVKEGGVLSQVQREINVEALPMEIPEHIELDVGGMAIGDTLRLADLPERAGVKYLDNPEETVLATVTLPTRVEEPEPEVEEGEELAEGEVPPEEQPEGAAEQPAEPTADAAGEPGTTEG
ncbi:MAG: 50S ribosomal protein L25 [Actinobacteria bacterium]|nr:MAG: 50S ribosomal protein L25 [Actinomycetota bacterium]